jgi:transcriptional regulator with XRE-family HTH domain
LKIDGKKLLDERTKANKTRAEVGAIMGVTYQRIQQLEKPGLHDIKPIILKAIAKFLGVKPQNLQ